MSDIRKILFYILLSVTFIISYLLAINIHNNRQTIENNIKIAVLNGIKLKENAKCFKLHEVNSDKLNNILKKIHESEMEIREKYGKIRKNSKLSSKQKQKEMSKLENNWKLISNNYNKEIQNIKTVDDKLTQYIYDKLNEVLKKFARKMNINAIFNKENNESIFVFYNNPIIDITDKVVDELNNELKDLNINKFYED